MYQIRSVRDTGVTFCQDQLMCDNDIEKILDHNSDQVIASSYVTTLYEPNLNVNDQFCEDYNIPNFHTLRLINNSEHYYTPKKCYINYPKNQTTIKRTFGQHFCRNKPFGVTKCIGKKKRKRTMFTTEQIIALEEVFHRKPYINREERILMSNKLQITEKSIKVWFQNRRRLADKRCNDYISDSPSSDDTLDTIADRLAIIESQINENTDEYGYVTLDNKTMSELVSIIDEYLSQDLNSVEEIVNPVNTTEYKVIYEPISPVSLTENSDDMDQRRNLFSQEAEQFSDIKSILFF